MANIPLRIDFPPLQHDPPTRTDLAAFYTVLDRWTHAVAQLLDYGVLTRSLGTNIAVPTGATGAAVTFAQAEPDTNYMIVVAPSWATSWTVTGKATTGFTVAFGSAAPAGATFSWMRVR